LVELACHPKVAVRPLVPMFRRPTLPAQQPTNRSSLLKRLGRSTGSSFRTARPRESVGMTRGCRPRPRWSSHPLCTRARSRPKPAPRANVGWSSRPPEGERSFQPPFAKTPGAVRRPHAKYPRQAVADAPRRSEERGGCRQHAEVDGPSSQAPIRSAGGGELPAVRPKPIHLPSAHHQLVSPDERLASPGHRVAPGSVPARAEARAFQIPGAGCPATSSGSNRSSFLRRSRSGLPRDFFRCEPKLAPSEISERVAPRLLQVRTEARSFGGLGAGCPRSNHSPKGTAVGWTLERPGPSSRVSTPASFRLRRFSRPWRFTPLRALRRVSVGHAHGVFLPGEQYPQEVSLQATIRRPTLVENPLVVHPSSPGRGPPKRSRVRPVPGKPGNVNRGVPAGV
jgi:hypothetical protein